MFHELFQYRHDSEKKKINKKYWEIKAEKFSLTRV